MTIEQLEQYVKTDEFKRRCAETRARQEAGEDFTIPQLAELIGVPEWFANMALFEVARRMDERLAPGGDAIQ